MSLETSNNEMGIEYVYFYNAIESSANLWRALCSSKVHMLLRESSFILTKKYCLFTENSEILKKT